MLDNLIASEESLQKGHKYSEEEIEALALKQVQEYRLHLEGVKEIFKGNNIVIVNGNRDQAVVLEDIA